MRRNLIGAVGGLAIWLSSALVAEAQGIGTIQPTGPMAIHVSDTQVQYTATITSNYSGTVYLTVFNNGTVVYGGQWYIVNGGPSFNFQSPVLPTSSWGLAVGNDIDFHLIWQVTPTHRVINDYNLTVQSGGTSMLPQQPSLTVMASALPYRRNWDHQDDLFAAEEGICA